MFMPLSSSVNNRLELEALKAYFASIYKKFNGNILMFLGPGFQKNRKRNKLKMPITEEKLTSDTKTFAIVIDN